MKYIMNAIRRANPTKLPMTIPTIDSAPRPSSFAGVGLGCDGVAGVVVVVVGVVVAVVGVVVVAVVGVAVVGVVVVAVVGVGGTYVSRNAKSTDLGTTFPFTL